MRKSWLVLLGTAIVLLLAQPAFAESARSFIDRAYAAEARHYGDPGSAQGLISLFDTRLGGLIARDLREAGTQSAPNLDYDPICQCQDDADLTHVVLSAHEHDQDAIVVVRNSFGTSGDPPIVVTYHLRRFAAGWRISDVETADVASLKRWLTSQLGPQKPGR